MFERKKYYKGFSTHEYESNGKGFDVYNVECIQRDLINEIFTIRGERVMMPTYGTRIPLLIFEINDAETERVIREDLTTVFKNDPRVQLLNLDVIQSSSATAIIAIAKLQYFEFDVVKDLNITINSA